MSRVLTKSQFDKPYIEILIEQLIYSGLSALDASFIASQLSHTTVSIQHILMESETQSLSIISDAINSAYSNERDKEKMIARDIKPREDDN